MRYVAPRRRRNGSGRAFRRLQLNSELSGGRKLPVPTRRERGGAVDTTCLNALTHDNGLLNGATPPRFPASLMLKEQRYLTALELGASKDVPMARAALVRAIESLLEADRERLRSLGKQLGSAR